MADTMMPATPENLERYINARDNAEQLSDFAESIKCTAAVITADRYKITFSDYSERGG